MNYLNIPLFVLLVSALYLCGVYLGLGLFKRVAMPRPKTQPLDSTDTVQG